MADNLPNLGGIFDRDNPWLVNEGGPTPPRAELTTEERARVLANEVNGYYTGYLGSEGDEREAYRDLALKAHRELVALVGEDEANRLSQRAQAFSHQDDAAAEQESHGGSLRDWEAYLRGKTITFNAGTEKQPIPIKKNFNDLPPETQQEMQAQAQEIFAATGDEDPFHIIDDFNAGMRGPGPEQLAAMAAVRQQQQQLRNEERAERLRRQAEREKIRQDFAEKQEARRQERQAALDAERQAAAQSREEREQQREADRQADRLANWQIRGEGQARIQSREAQSAADRAQREAERQANQQNAAQKALKAADARRKQLALDTATQATKLITNTQVRLEALPQPGGIGLLLITIIFILFAIQPSNANGATRLQLMWYALLPWNTVTLPYDTEASSGNGSGSGSGSGNNGSGGNPGSFQLPGGFGGLNTNAAAGGSGGFPHAGVSVAPPEFPYMDEMPYALRSSVGEW